MLLMPSFKELHQIRLSNFSITDPCDKLGHISNINHTFEFQKTDEYQEWKYLFNFPATVKPILVLCNPQNPRPTYTLSINYTNPNALLDLRWIPSLIIKPVAISLFALVFLFMFFNIFKFQKNASRYNILVMVSTLFILLYTIFSYLQLNHDYYSDKHTPFRELSITSYFVGRVLIFMAVLLGSNGWEIINTEYSKMYILRPLFSLLYYLRHQL
ncbi:hypothetical protein TVAG_150320 [Trichomonas vaginalis G3]|uniref:Intimal thickness related receptor IRP domain-containing protein n=1 Tax=Trichomonas vaginalis (strain ATCC PRA-98 / G3) TaxID=412133 RepID=A2DRT4_TRIV3|nr:lung seven transmembrane receptor family [Trichomonas vaginalis G3]EAY16881.1 hypothetical protein TVAG_150320 [Trichomonas vaginalis G3]KAI5489131.1 lung seven transmembrane receptor family [Trichomonas vaginalis G3]|eukprot:XP_001329104.1 hypothetical protein [Trichomonas vaginalis G3]